jgi:hypothetical protein
MNGLDRRAAALVFLESHGAATVPHPGGTLLTHLVRTERQLRDWDADDDLAIAGLCHAAYGTHGFAPSLIDRSDRVELIELIGAAAEAIVHRYASCDRESFYPQLGVVEQPRFRDRFTGELMVLTDAEMRAFITLTVANELDVMNTNPTLAATHGQAFAELFRRCEHLMPPAAVDGYRAVLDPHAGGSERLNVRDRPTRTSD